jgi:hypothetical protein
MHATQSPDQGIEFPQQQQISPGTNPSSSNVMKDVPTKQRNVVDNEEYQYF